MHLDILAVGRMKPGPEQDLFEDYRTRIDRTGRPLSLGPLGLIEIDERKARSKADQSTALLGKVPDGAISVALDERARPAASEDLARELARWRDDGRSRVCFLIGGADGHDASLRKDADLLLSFGPMVWPHMLVRVMLAEQLYRAASILAGTPYHRA